MKRLALSAALLALALPLAAQEPVIAAPEELPPGVVLPNGAVLNAASPAAAKPKSPEEEKLGQLMKLSFDRRPQAVLRAHARQLDASARATNDVQQFQQDVEAGRWNEVGAFLQQLPEPQQRDVYRHVLQSLSLPPGGPRQPGQEGVVVMPDGSAMPGTPPQMQPQPLILIEDVLALADAAPGQLQDREVQWLGQLLARARNAGSSTAPLLARLEAGTAKLGGTDPARRRLAVKLLSAAGATQGSERLLPGIEAARKEQDWAALDLHAQLALIRGRNAEPEQYDTAWKLTLELLAVPRPPGVTNDLPTRDALLQRVLVLLPLVRQQTATNWLRETFETHPERGLLLLGSVLGASPSQNRQPDARLESLTTQATAAGLLLVPGVTHSPHWQAVLNAIALNWIREGENTRRLQHMLRRTMPNPSGYSDPYEEMELQRQMNAGNQLLPIAPEELLAITPSPEWIAMLDPGLRPKVWSLAAWLSGKAEKPDEAVVWLARLAPQSPEEARSRTVELLQNWAESHNPNANPNPRRTMYGPYGSVYYGPGSPYGMRPPGTSLTRALQIRNLAELAALLHQLRTLPIKPVEDSVVVGAFSAAHSDAEVFRREDIERVFGPIAAMSPKTLAELVQTMRGRLATQWRQARVQEAAQTKRSDKERDAEVLRGYEALAELLEAGLKRAPDDWQLRLAQATAAFDRAEFQYGNKVDLAIYVEEREKAFKAFEQAAALYARQLDPGRIKAETALPFTLWFNANLGASDLGYVTRQQEPSSNQVVRIRAAVNALPGEAAERHWKLLAADLDENVGSLKPELKPRYVRTATRLLGNRPDAAKLRKLARSYEDLLGEMELHARVDGDPSVGHAEPFGLFITLRHSKEIERESGGFTKYVRASGSGMQQYYYGGMTPPRQNVREDFEKHIRERLADGFEVKAITFHDEKLQSRSYGRDGWRETPLAYVLLRAKDAATDRIPSLHLDMDFNDTSGLVLLPVESSALLVDARADHAPARPVEKLELTQVLDDREAAQGKLTLDIRATAHGLVPALGALLDNVLPGFKVIKTDEQPMIVSKLDSESDSLAAVSERSWLLQLAPADGAEVPAKFQFPKSRFADARVTYKRYTDADLVEVDAAPALVGIALRPDWSWVWWLMGGLVLAVAGVLWLRLSRRTQTKAGSSAAYALPAHVTPFTVLTLLRRMQADGSLPLSAERRSELTSIIGELEQDYFGRRREPLPQRDLGELARRWLAHGQSA